MCNEWKAIEASIRATVKAAGASRFGDLSRNTEVSVFPDAEDLLQHLRDRDSAFEERDHLLAILVKSARGRDSTAALARGLLWLALWPGLTALLGKTKAWRIDDKGDLIAEITAHFTYAIEYLDLGHCKKIAATLLWNTRRGVVETLRQRSIDRATERPFSAEAEAEAESAAMPPPTADVMDVIADLRHETPEDAEVIIACVLEGQTTREFARLHNEEREAVKKRLQRALDRVREAMSAETDESDVPNRPQNPLIEIRGNDVEVEEAADEPGKKHGARAKLSRKRDSGNRKRAAGMRVLRCANRGVSAGAGNSAPPNTSKTP